MPLTASDVRTAPEWPALEAWARERPRLVESVYLLGSRMRGDHGPDSDLDIALVGGPWRGGSLSGLPRELGGVRPGWIPLNRERFEPPPRVMCIPWVLLRHGVRLWGRPLPELAAREEGPAMNMEDVQYNLDAAIECARQSAEYLQTLQGLHPKHPKYPPVRRFLAAQSGLAAEFAGKAALALRGLEPHRSHSVADLCADLVRNNRFDPLIDSLEPLNGDTEKAHVAIYLDSDFKEPPERSGARAAGALHAAAAIVLEIAPLRGRNEGKFVASFFLRRLRNSISLIADSERRRRFEDGLCAIEAANRLPGRSR